MNYRHLSIEERSCIRKYYVDGLSYREIARLIGRNVSTVSREIRRNCTHMYDIPTYYPHTAQKLKTPLCRCFRSFHNNS
jgi:IS30 family transposase